MKAIVTIYEKKDGVVLYWYYLENFDFRSFSVTVSAKHFCEFHLLKIDPPVRFFFGVSGADFVICVEPIARPLLIANTVSCLSQPPKKVRSITWKKHSTTNQHLLSIQFEDLSTYSTFRESFITPGTPTGQEVMIEIDGEYHRHRLIFEENVAAKEELSPVLATLTCVTHPSLPPLNRKQAMVTYRDGLLSGIVCDLGMQINCHPCSLEGICGDILELKHQGSLIRLKLVNPFGIYGEQQAAAGAAPYKRRQVVSILGDSGGQLRINCEGPSYTLLRNYSLVSIGNGCIHFHSEPADFRLYIGCPDKEEAAPGQMTASDPETNVAEKAPNCLDVVPFADAISDVHCRINFSDFCRLLNSPITANRQWRAFQQLVAALEDLGPDNLKRILNY